MITPPITWDIERSWSVRSRAASRRFRRPVIRRISALTLRSAWTMTGDILMMEITPAAKIPPIPM